MEKYVISFLFVLITLVGCNENKNFSQTVNIADVETIYINHGSDNIHLKSADQSNLEASFYNKDVELEQNGSEVTLSVKKSLFHIGPKINLNKKFQVTIPNDFSGSIIINGTSGNLTSENLETNNLEINGKSGNVTLDFSDFHSDVKVKTTSGNIKLMLNEEQPDIELKSKTGSGKQTVTIPLVLTKQTEKKLEGKSVNGTYSINLTTASGNITVQQ